MKVWKIIARVLTIAYDIAGGLILGVFIGAMLDRYLHTKAIFTIVLSIWGVIHGFRMMLKIGE